MITFQHVVLLVFTICLITAAGIVTAMEPTSDPSLTEPPLSDLDRDYWAYQPVVRPAVPELPDDNWSRNPIDRFVLAKLRQENLQPVEPAERLTLLRRVTFDLTGLPPTLAEQTAAESATDFDSAYAEIVERLLTSPAHGEHWAQHWLDLVRFAETDGFEHDLVRPEAWRYRDWVINALNTNLPFDQFVKLQLAADELVEPSDPHRIATGYLLAGPDMPDLNSQEERRHIYWNAMTANVGEVFLGLHFECAECHHHKVDPISHHDFYRLRSFFETIDLFPGKPKSEANDPDAKPDFPTRKLSVERVVWNRERDIPTSHLWIRGDFRRPGPKVTAQFPRALTKGESVASFTSATGRRTALADWFTHRDHPLTARVMVNRVWQQHFGVGLKSTPSDFGWQGDDASHPELLDWLAAEFMDNGWNLRELHRLIVTSATYRLASYPIAPPANSVTEKERLQRWQSLVAKDRTNRWLGRFPRQRLSGEAIRDALLAVSGEINSKSGGPGVLPPLPADVASTLLKGQWPVTKDESEHTRRSIYLFARRNLRLPLLEAYDKPDTNLSCARRTQSTIAPQALHLLNSEFVRTIASNLAQRVQTDCHDSLDRIVAAYRLALGRPPAPSELAAAGNFLARTTDESAWVDFCHSLLNLNEFLYID